MDSCSDVIAALLAAHKGRLFAILDEFEAVAPQLRKEDQAELRAAAANLPGFAYVVPLALKPGNLLEYIGEVASDLAPDLQAVHPALDALLERDVRSLIGVGRTQLGLEADADAEDVLLEFNLGGHPLLVQSASYGWYAAAGARLLRELSREELRVARERVELEVATQWPYVERALRLQDSVAWFGGAVRTFASLASRIGTSVVGERAGTFTDRDLRGSGDSPADEFVIAVAELNAKHRRHVLAPVDVIEPSAFGTNDGVLIRRRVGNEEDFKELVLALSRILYDGSGAAVSPELRGRVRPRLPAACYRDPRSPLLHLICLRNHYVHAASQVDEIETKHLRSVAEVFQLYCAKLEPVGDDWEAIRLGLLKACATLLRQIVACADDEGEPTLFAGSSPGGRLPSGQQHGPR